MSKKYAAALAALVSLVSLVALASCAVPDGPAWKADSGKATFALSVGGSDPSARAMCLGTGYLYIRTLGGPSGGTGPFYGPFTVTKGSVFTTEDIPAGAYTGIFILYATKPLAGRSAVFRGSTVAFADAMRLSDTDFTEFTSSAGADSPMQTLVDGFGSAASVTNVDLLPAKVNTVKATLLPLVSTATTFAFSGNDATIAFPANTVVERRFFRVNGAYDGLATGATVASLTCTLSVNKGTELGPFQLFAADGRLITAIPLGHKLIADDIATLSFDVAAIPSACYYVYGEYLSTGASVQVTRKLN